VNIERERNVEPSEVTNKLVVMTVGGGVITATVTGEFDEVDVRRVVNVEPSKVTSESVVRVVGGGVITDGVTDWAVTAIVDCVEIDVKREVNTGGTNERVGKVQ
jgi:hypothetical protein